MNAGDQLLARRIFEGLSTSYDRVLNAVTLMQDQYWKTWLLEKAKIDREKVVLDIGCGTGVLEERMPNLGKVIGVDITEDMLRLAQKKRLPSLKALGLGDGERLPFRDGSFDTVVSCYVVKYCNPSTFVLEVARVLRPGGTFVIYDFSSPRGWLAPFHAVYVYGFLKIMGMAVRLFDPGAAFTYSVLPDVIRTRLWDSRFGELLEFSGFSQVETKRLSGGVVTGYFATKKSR